MSDEVQAEAVEEAKPVEVALPPEPVRKPKVLDNMQQLPNGSFVNQKTLNYVYFNDHSITKYYKEGFTEEVAYTDELKKALQIIEDA